MSASAAPARPLALRALLTALARTLGVLLAVAAVWYTVRIATDALPGFPGRDAHYYFEGAARWLSTGSPYLPAEVANDFVYQEETFLHPPISLLVFAPFLALPSILWWVLPLGFLAAFVAWCRPAAWAWPALGFALLWHHTAVAIVAGNSDLWIAAFIAGGLLLGWPLALVVVKPSLAFMGVLGVRKPRFWLGAAAVAALALPFGTLWIDWLRVVQHSPGQLTYSMTSLPLMLLPVVAWVARRGGEGPALRSPEAQPKGTPSGAETHTKGAYRQRELDRTQ
jgi:hypothetical protein